MFRITCFYSLHLLPLKAADLPALLKEAKNRIQYELFQLSTNFDIFTNEELLKVLSQRGDQLLTPKGIRKLLLPSLNDVEKEIQK